jgi:hypothetical protein
MSQIGASSTSAAPSVHAADEITAQRPLKIYSCNRLGRVANPPKFSFVDWFRFARRR